MIRIEGNFKCINPNPTWGGGVNLASRFFSFSKLNLLNCMKIFRYIPFPLLHHVDFITLNPAACKEMLPPKPTCMIRVKHWGMGGITIYKVHSVWLWTVAFMTLLTLLSPNRATIQEREKKTYLSFTKSLTHLIFLLWNDQWLREKGEEEESNMYVCIFIYHPLHWLHLNH